MEAFAAASERAPIDTVCHLAANSDILAGIADASIDLRDTFLTTFHVLGAMRRFGVATVAFASSSAIYGVHQRPLAEDTGPLFPISNYGAMKLALEAIISVAAESFLSRASLCVSRMWWGTSDSRDHLRFDPRAATFTEGARGDGDGNRAEALSPACVGAGRRDRLFITSHAMERLNVFNISVSGEGVTVRSVAETVVRLVAPGTPIGYESKDRGWVGDVRFQYAIDKLSALGWVAELIFHAGHRAGHHRVLRIDRRMQLVILAGKGTRLRSRLGDLPKTLAPVGGRPILLAKSNWVADIHSTTFSCFWGTDVRQLRLGREMVRRPGAAACHQRTV